MVMVQEWNFTWPLLSPGAISKSERQHFKVRETTNSKLERRHFKVRKTTFHSQKDNISKSERQPIQRKDNISKSERQPIQRKDDISKSERWHLKVRKTTSQSQKNDILESERRHFKVRKTTNTKLAWRQILKHVISKFERQHLTLIPKFIEMP